jgi:hypothetical protein
MYMLLNISSYCHMRLAHVLCSSLIWHAPTALLVGRHVTSDMAPCEAAGTRLACPGSTAGCLAAGCPLAASFWRFAHRAYVQA